MNFDEDLCLSDEEEILQESGTQKIIHTDSDDQGDYSIESAYFSLDSVMISFYYYKGTEEDCALPVLPIKDISLITREDCCGEIDTILTDINDNYFVIEGCPGELKVSSKQDILYRLRDKYKTERAKYE